MAGGQLYLYQLVVRTCLPPTAGGRDVRASSSGVLPAGWPRQYGPQLQLSGRWQRLVDGGLQPLPSEHGSAEDMRLWRAETPYAMLPDTPELIERRVQKFFSGGVF